MLVEERRSFKFPFVLPHPARESYKTSDVSDGSNDNSECVGGAVGLCLYLLLPVSSCRRLSKADRGCSNSDGWWWQCFVETSGRLEVLQPKGR